jgi:hypothetical protein
MKYLFALSLLILMCYPPTDGIEYVTFTLKNKAGYTKDITVTRNVLDDSLIT